MNKQRTENELAYGRMRLNASGWKEFDIHNDYLPFSLVNFTILPYRHSHKYTNVSSQTIKSKKNGKNMKSKN